MWHRFPEARLLDGGWIDPGQGWSLVTDVEPPEEMYLRLARDTDLSDPEALLRIVREVGGMVPFESYARDFGEHREWYEVGWRRLAANRDLWYSQRPNGGVFHVAEVAWRLRVLDACGRVVVAYRSGDFIWPVWADLLLEGARDKFMKLSKDRREARAWEDWLELMNPALRRWHVRPILHGLGHLSGDELAPTLLEVGALQIMNDLAREAEYHVCANETCGRTFAKQIGGGESFSRRTGVRYCSPPCKNAQMQREHRRRAKARREASR